MTDPDNPDLDDIANERLKVVLRPAKDGRSPGFINLKDARRKVGKESGSLYLRWQSERKR